MKKISVNLQKMNSLEIAELTRKNHFHVLRDIRELNKGYEKLDEIKIGFKLIIIELGHNRQRKDTFYELTKMQTLDLLTGYSAELRIKVNRRWAELEEKEKFYYPASVEYNGVRCIHYTSWLLQNKYSLMSSCVHGRIRKNPSQFRKGKEGWYMSEAIAQCTP